MVTLDQLKALAKKFASQADDAAKIQQLVTSTLAAHPGDTEVTAMCNNIKAAQDAAAIRVITNGVTARTT